MFSVCLSIVVNNIMPVCAFSCFVDTGKMTGIHLEQIKVYKGICLSKALTVSFNCGWIIKQTGRPMTKTNIESERQAGIPHPGRQSPQMASEVAVPEIATLRPRILQEVCGRQSLESNMSEKLPVGHNRHCTSSVGLWICPQAWKE